MRIRKSQYRNLISLWINDRWSIEFEYDRARLTQLLFGKDFGDGGKYYLSLAIFRVFLHLSIHGFSIKGSDAYNDKRDLGISFSEGTIYLHLWSDRTGWGPDRTVHFNPIDFVFGRKKYSESAGIVSDIGIPMPESEYPATIKLYTARWKRPRWFKTTSVNSADVEIHGDGIPFPGKGDNSWDCGDDALFGGTYRVSTVDEAVEQVVKNVMYYRDKYPL